MAGPVIFRVNAGRRALAAGMPALPFASASPRIDLESTLNHMPC
jgi:hypothetical protein